MSRGEFAERPPVLLDIGASGAVHPKWAAVAKYSVCVAFDADEREMGYTEKQGGVYRKHYVYNCIVTDATGAGGAVEERDFYLTRSPYCSSLLPPDNESLSDWSFHSLFEVERVVKLRAAALTAVLDELKIEKADWFKTDSQGTDLRLFTSLGDARMKRTLVAEFEPGIIDAYRGEDKFWMLLRYMDAAPFFMSGINICGTQRIGKEGLALLGEAEKKALPMTLRESPGWAETTYMNEFREDADYLDKRDFMLGWVFAEVEGQHGFAAEVAARGMRKFGDGIFTEMRDGSLRKLVPGAGLSVRRFMRRALGRLNRVYK